MNLAVVSFFPLLAAMMYGLAYALYPSIAKQVSLVSFMLLNSAIQVVVFLAIAALWNGGSELKAIYALSSRQMALVLGFGALGVCAWVLTLISADKLSPTYAAVGEISYVLFVPLFSWLIFGQNHMDRYTAVAAALILAGSFVLVYGKIHGKPADPLLVSNPASVSTVAVKEDAHA